MNDTEIIDNKVLFHYEAILSVDGVNSMTEYHCNKMVRNRTIRAFTKKELKDRILKIIDEFVLEINGNE